MWQPSPKELPVFTLTCSRVDPKCHECDFVGRPPLTRPLSPGQRCGLSVGKSGSCTPELHWLKFHVKLQQI